MTAVSNPLLPGCYPDPSICRFGDWFYLVNSTFEYLPGLPVFRSRDLSSWEQVGHVVHRPGQLAGRLALDHIDSSGGLYAPTLREHAGRFWVVCTVVDREDASRGGHVLFTADDPAGPWSDGVWLAGEGIDPSLFFDDDGRVWFHATRPAHLPQWDGQTEVWLRELDLHTLELIGPEHVLWIGALRGAVWAEGPHLFRVDGHYVLLAAEGGTERNHAVCVARADAVTGPYLGNPANPMLTHRHLGQGFPVTAVGHADLVQAADGSWWAVLLAMRPRDGHVMLGRETFLVPVVWQDGWPVFSPGAGRVPDSVEVPFAAPTTPSAPRGIVSGLVPANDPRWCTPRALPTLRATATPDGRGWRIPACPATPADVGGAAFLGLRLQHHEVELRVRLRTELALGEEAGLLVRQSEADHLRLTVVGDRVRAVHRRAGTETVLGEMSRPVEPEVTLTARVRGGEIELLIGDGVNETVVGCGDGRLLDSASTGGFLGLWAGVYVTSNGAPGHGSVTAETEYLPAG